MVLEHAIDSSDAILVNAKHPVAAYQLTKHEVGVGEGELARLRLVERTRHLGQRPQHQRVPSGEDLLVARRPDPRGARGVQRLANLHQLFVQRRDRNPFARRNDRRIGRNMQNVPTLEISGFGNAVVRNGPLRELGSQQLVQLIFRPDVETSFLPLTIGIERSKEPARRRRHLAADPCDSFVYHSPDFRATGCLTQMRPQSEQQCIVVEHLLEVGHQPLSIHGIPCEATAYLVVDAPARHCAERIGGDLKRPHVASAPPVAENKVQGHGLREFRRPFEATEAGVESLGNLAKRRLEQCGIQCSRCARRLLRHLVDPAELLRALLDVAAPVSIGIGDGVQHARKGGEAVPVLRRKVGSPIKR